MIVEDEEDFCDLSKLNLEDDEQKHMEKLEINKTLSELYDSCIDDKIPYSVEGLTAYKQLLIYSLANGGKIYIENKLYDECTNEDQQSTSLIISPYNVQYIQPASDDQVFEDMVNENRFFTTIHIILPYPLSKRIYVNEKHLRTLYKKFKALNLIEDSLTMRLPTIEDNVDEDDGQFNMAASTETYQYFEPNETFFELLNDNTLNFWQFSPDDV